jgi:hypothetical protein
MQREVALRLGEPRDFAGDATRGEPVDAAGEKQVDHAPETVAIDVTGWSEGSWKNGEDAAEGHDQPSMVYELKVACHKSQVVSHSL